MSSGCGCKEVYRFPHITYPYSSCICSFLQQHPTFCSFLKCFSFLFQYIFVIYLITFSRSINKYKGDSVADLGGDLRVPWNPPFSPGYVQTL